MAVAVAVSVSVCRSSSKHKITTGLSFAKFFRILVNALAVMSLFKVPFQSVRQSRRWERMWMLVFSDTRVRSAVTHCEGAVDEGIVGNWMV